jgi:hypothetical protein
MAEGRAGSGKTALWVGLVICVALGASALYLVRSDESRQQLTTLLYRARSVPRDKAALPQRLAPTADSLPQLGSGWIYLGTYDAGKRAFGEGPYAEVAYCASGGRSGPVVPHRGDVLRIRESRQVIIGNYRIEGLTHLDTPPPLVHELLSGLDTTGVDLAAGDLVVVRDVQAPRRLGKPRSLWCRVEPCDPASEPGAQARADTAAGRARP